MNNYHVLHGNSWLQTSVLTYQMIPGTLVIASVGGKMVMRADFRHNYTLTNGTTGFFNSQVEIGQVKLTTAPVPPDPDTFVKNPCLIWPGNHAGTSEDPWKAYSPHGIASMVPDEIAVGDYFTFDELNPNFTNGWNGHPADCVYRLGSDPGTDYLQKFTIMVGSVRVFAIGDPSSIVNLWGKQVWNFVTRTQNGCVENQSTLTYGLLRIVRPELDLPPWNTRTCVFHGTGKTKEEMEEEELRNMLRNAIEITVVGSPDQLASVLEPGDPIVSNLTQQELIDATFAALDDMGDPGFPSVGELPDSNVAANASVNVEVKHEGIDPCTDQTYYHPMNYYADHGCSQHFDKAWGPTPFDPLKAAVWADAPTPENAALEQLHVLNPSNPEQVIPATGAISNGSTVKLPPGSSVPSGTPGTEGGGGTGSIPAPGNPGTPEGGWYESQYPDGIEGIFEGFSDDVMETAFGDTLKSFELKGSGGTGDLCWKVVQDGQLSFNVPSLCLSEQYIAIAKIIFIFGALMYARSLVFGG